MPGPHDKIIATVAKAALASLNFRQKGRSRVWLSDHGWWLIIVEFQSSRWSKGCYLNVGAHWLWNEASFPSFDYGGRVAEFQEYESDSQFTLATGEHARKAVVASNELVLKFPSLEAVAGALVDEVRSEVLYRGGHPGWAPFHAGVASALVGRSNDATDMLARAAASAPPETFLGRRAAELLVLVSDLPTFKIHVASLIECGRRDLKLADKPVHI